MLSSGKIKDMVVKGMVNDMTKMVLVNAIYFKGNWNAAFQRSNTREVQFRLNKVTMITNTDYFLNM